MVRGLAIFFGILALLGLTVEVTMRYRERARGHGMEVAAQRALLGGGLQGLLRARSMALGSSAVSGNVESVATLALANAMLASEYGLDEAAAALAAAELVEASPGASPRAQALKLASRALVELTNGHLDRAEAQARRSVALGHKQASPLFALGRVRFRQGDLSAAAHAFQAALVREPSFVEARVAWAEVWLEQGERTRAWDALLAALKRTPDHGRARLLLAELEAASAEDAVRDAPWEKACVRDEATSPFLASTCALARAHRAWRARDWAAAVELAEAAGRYRPIEPRVLGGAAQLLACVGAVDKATACLNAATGVASPALPSLTWARAAIELGRGQLIVLPQELPAGASFWAAQLKARIALASGGNRALAAGLTDATGASPELEVLAATAGDGEREDAKGQPAALEPVRAYVKGMQARLAGNPASAAELLAKALERHGDACRAAGEYLAACGAVGRVPDRSVFGWLLGNNARCVNLPAAFAAAGEKRARRPSGQAARGAR